MAESQATPPKRSPKGRTKPIVVRPPLTAPLSDTDRQQAVSALASMIAAWWADHQQANDL